jgi:HTH-type transcriptional regulator/antitoxin HigA
MEINAIKDEVSYQAALKEIDGLMMAKLNTPEGDRLDVLVTLVQAYEAKHYPIELPTPIEAIKFRMEQGGLTPQDLVPAIGALNRVYEVLAGKRSLSISMIRRLHEMFNISAEVLIQEPAEA